MVEIRIGVQTRYTLFSESLEEIKMRFKEYTYDEHYPYYENEEVYEGELADGEYWLVQDEGNDNVLRYQLVVTQGKVEKRQADPSQFLLLWECNKGPVVL